MSSLILSLYVLLTMDTAFSGVCAASGRNALIHKRTYYLRSMWHGALWGQAACLVGILILLIAISLSQNGTQTLTEMQTVGWRMSAVYWLYAAAVLFTFLVRAVPSVDIRSMTSTIAFGPLTFIRPAVILLGVIWGLQVQPSVPVVIAAILVAVLMMPFRVFLDGRFAKMKTYQRK